MDLESTMVQIVNNGKEVLHLKEGGNEFVVPPGQPTFIPYSTVVAWFGDPEARDLSKRESYRRDELERMRVMWGIYNKGKVPDDFPQIEITKVDTGERVWSVVEDPLGTHTSAMNTQSTDARNSAEMVQTLQTQIASMQAQIAAMSSPETPTGDEPLLDAAPEEPAPTPIKKKAAAKKAAAKVDGPKDAA